MTPIAFLGYNLAFWGAVFGLAGAYYTSSPDVKDRHIGFFLWVLNSPMLVGSMIGVAFGWFAPISAFILVPLNCIYFLTAYRGYLNTKSEPYGTELNTKSEQMNTNFERFRMPRWSDK